MLFQMGSRMISMTRKLTPPAVHGVSRAERPLSLWPRALDRLRGTLELRKVIAEHAGELACLLVVRVLVVPRTARVQDLLGDIRHRLRYVEAEDRIGGGRHLVERPAQQSVDHGSRVAQLHSLAHAVRATAPAGVEEPDVGAVLAQQLAEH